MNCTFTRKFPAYKIYPLVAAFFFGIWLQLASFSALAQPSYCTGGIHMGTCDTNNNIDDVSITGTTLQNLNTGCAFGPSWGYSSFPATGSTTATLQRGVSYSLSVTGPAMNFISAWIDYDQDGLFEASEYVAVAAPSTPNVAATVNFTVPLSATLGLTGLRIRSKTGGPNGPNDACTQFLNGETEDYTITIAAPPACSGTPNPGTITGTLNVCTSQTTQLTLAGQTLGTTLQWQSSPDGTNWTDLTGQTGIGYATGPVTATTYYRVNVACNATVVPTPTVQVFPGNGSVSSFPYSQNFDAATVPNMPCGWTTLDANNDARTWLTTASDPSSPPNAVRYTFHGSNAANDWLFSPALTLDANKQYLVTFKYRAGSPLWVEGLEVKFGSSNTAAGMTNLVYSNTNITNTNYITVTTAPLTPAAAGTYYVGFHAISAANKLYLYLDDVTITEVAVCNAAPVAGTVPTGPVAICNSNTNTLTATGATQGSGIVYQWEESDDNGVADAWANAVGGSGANGTTFTLPNLSVSRYYRLKVTCSTTSQFATTSSVQVTVNPLTACYCSSNLHTGTCNTTDNINTVSISGTTLNNANTGCTALNGPAYSRYPATGTTTATLQRQLSYNLNVTSPGNTRLFVWIDYNQNGVFEASEWQLITAAATGNVVATTVLNIPANAVLGQTGMRIRSQLFGMQHTGADACTMINTGETEDYIITIGAAPVCTSPPTPGTISGNLNLCSGQTTQLTLNGQTLGTTLQWQSSTDNITWTDITGATNSTFSTAALTVSTYFRVNVTCNGTTVPTPALQAIMGTGSVATFPYVQNFDNLTVPALPCGWTVLDANNDTKTWTTAAIHASTAPNALQYEFDQVNNANDWVFTPALQLVANKKYQVTFKHRNEQIGWAQAMEVKFGTAATPAGMTTVLFSNSNLTSQTYSTVNLPILQPTTSGTYYIGFHVTSPAFRYNLYLDDFSIIELPGCTGMPTAGTLPTGPVTVCHTNTNVLSATGASNASGITYQWEESDDDGVNDAWANVAGGSGGNTTDYTLPITLPVSRYYRLKVTCSTTSQTATSASVEVYSPYTSIFTFPHLQNFELATMPQLPCGWTVLDVNNDGKTWEAQPMNPTSAGPMALRYGAHPTNTANDWAFSPEVEMTAGHRYRIGFKSMVASNGFPEGLEVKVGTARTPAAMTTTVFRNQNLTNMNMVSAVTTPFVAPTTGNYYVGLHAISFANQFFLVVDDFLIEDLGLVGVKEELAAGLQIYPNPSQGKFRIAFETDLKKPVKAVVFNALGQEVYQQAHLEPASELDLRYLANGMYLLRLEIDGKFITKRLVIEGK